MENLLNPSNVEKHHRIVVFNLLVVKDHIDIAVDECETEHLDNLGNCVCDRSLYVGWPESAILNEFLIEKVVSVQLNLFRADHYNLGELSQVLISEAPYESHRRFKAVLKRTEHLMMDAGVEGGHQL